MTRRRVCPRERLGGRPRLARATPGRARLAGHRGTRHGESQLPPSARTQTAAPHPRPGSGLTAPPHALSGFQLSDVCPQSQENKITFIQTGPRLPHGSWDRRQLVRCEGREGSDAAPRAQARVISGPVLRRTDDTRPRPSSFPGGGNPCLCKLLYAFRDLSLSKERSRLR